MPPKKGFRKVLARYGRSINGRPVRRVLSRAEKRARHKDKVKAEIRVWQKEPCFLWSEAAFKRIVREILHNRRPTRDFMVSRSAYEALAEAAQQHVYEFFLDADLAREISGRQTLMVRDTYLVRELWARFNERTERYLNTPKLRAPGLTGRAGRIKTMIITGVSRFN